LRAVSDSACGDQMEQVNDAVNSSASEGDTSAIVGGNTNNGLHIIVENESPGEQPLRALVSTDLLFVLFGCSRVMMI
jgi:hypothetical protein